MRQSVNTEDFYIQLDIWIRKGCPKHPFFKSDVDIFSNAVLWDSGDMSTAKDVFQSLIESRNPLLNNLVFDHSVKKVMMLENGTYYKNQSVFDFIHGHIPFA